MKLDELCREFKIDKKYIFTFNVSIICFFLTHAYFFTGKFANEDYFHRLSGYTGNPESGRWLGGIITSYLMPWVIGVICCIFISLAVVLIVDMLKIENKLLIVITAGMLISFPTLAYSFPYLFMADVYAIALFFGVFAVWVTTKHKYGFILGALALMLSLAEYQSYIGVAVTLCVIILIINILDDEFELKCLFALAFKFALMGMLGFVFYKIGLNIVLTLNNLELSDYKGIDTMGQIPLNQVPSLLYKTYTRFLNYFSGKTFFYTTNFIKYINYINIFIILVLIGTRACQIKNILRWILLICLVMVLPLAINIVDFMAPESSSSTLNIYAMVFLFVFPLALLPCNKLLNKSILFTTILLLATGSIMVNNFVTSNLYYEQVRTVYEYSAHFYNRLLIKIEETEGYNNTVPVAIIANNTVNTHNLRTEKFSDIQSDQGIWGNYIGMNGAVGRESATAYKSIQMIQYILGANIKSATSAEIATIMQTEEYKQMGSYPSKDCTKIIDGVLVLKMIEEWSIDIKINEETLKFEVFYPSSQRNNQYNIAWYIYKNDERIEVLWYEKNNCGELSLPKDEIDGEYYVTCYIKDDEGNAVRSSFNSEKIIFQEMIEE
ncbi:MAG: glucosyltransferase domain-containing protein [Clostridia bacterium]